MIQSLYLQEYDRFKAALQDKISPADTLKDRFNAPTESQSKRYGAEWRHTAVHNKLM